MKGFASQEDFLQPALWGAVLGFAYLLGKWFVIEINRYFYFGCLGCFYLSQILLVELRFERQKMLFVAFFDVMYTVIFANRLEFQGLMSMLSAEICGTYFSYLLSNRLLNLYEFLSFEEFIFPNLLFAQQLYLTFIITLFYLFCPYNLQDDILILQLLFIFLMLRKNATQIIKSLSRYQRYSNQSIKQKNSYPYKFGGVQCKQQNTNTTLFMRQLFGQNIRQGFKTAYSATLSALRDRDKQFIQETMSVPLAKQFDLIDLQLINPQSSIQVYLHRFFMGIGGKINRSGEECKAIAFKNKKMKQGIDFYSLPFSQREFSPNPQLPIIIGCQVYFNSPTKLQKSPAITPNNSSQCHMLQFQIQNTIKMLQMVQIIPIIQKLNSSKDQKFDQYHQIIKKFVGNNYEWKITDMDVFLRGNFEIFAGGDAGSGGFGKFF